MPRRAICILAIASASLAMAACGGGSGSSSSASLPAGCEHVSKPPPKHRELTRPKETVRTGERLTAVVDTSCGRFDIRLDTDRFPKTANSFSYLARKGFYDDTIFHRIVPRFIVQGGDPLQNGHGGPGYTVTERPPANTQYTMGTVAMAKTPVEPAGRSGSQFFVVTAANAGLPPEYAILGVVTKGLKVVEKIGKLGNRQTEQPTRRVVVLRMTLI
jgi:peptidyl-prolyl cis-trans isomerase B (cyclophilin B)